MNPWHWTREHQLALIIVSLVGMAAGVLFGFIHSPYFAIFGTWQVFATWLSHPALYWPWPLSGLVLTAVGFYGVQLLRNSN